MLQQSAATEGVRGEEIGCCSDLLYRTPDVNHVRLSNPERVILVTAGGLCPKGVIMMEMTILDGTDSLRKFSPEVYLPHTTHGITSCTFSFEDLEAYIAKISHHNRFVIVFLLRKRRGPSAPGRARSSITSFGYRSIPFRCHFFPFLYIFNFE